jgi:PBSX family phage portal protein
MPTMPNDGEITKAVVKSDDYLDQELIVEPDTDPFNKTWDEIKGYRGLDKNFKRREDRNLDKNVMSPAYERSSGAVDVGIDDAKSKRLNPGAVYRNAYGIFDIITPPYDVNALAGYYDTSFANHAAVDAKVQNIVGLGYEFKVSDKALMVLEIEEDKEKVKRSRVRIQKLQNQLRVWLESLNSDDSFTNTMQKVYTDVNATGNGYLEIGRTTNGTIGYLGHIPSTTMRVRRLHDGFVQIIANKVVYFRNFGASNQNPITDDPRPNEIIHIKEYSPLNTFYGVPDVISAMPSIIGDAFASQYNIDYFQNKAVPRYIVTLKGAQLSAEAEDKLFRFLQTGLKSQNHRTLYIPLPGDSDHNKVEFKMEPIENGIQEGSFKEYRKHVRDDILIAHQVPLSKLGGGDSSNIAAALAQDRTFKEQVARPAQRNLEKIIEKIIKEKTDVLDLKFVELTLTDEVAQSQIIERYVKTQVMTPNEARNRLQLPQRPDGDTPFELSARQATDARANTAQNRSRDTERSNNQSDGTATTSGRNPKGEGRSSN